MPKKQFNILMTKTFFILLLCVMWPITAIIALIGFIQTAAQLVGFAQIEGLTMISQELIKYFTTVARYITGLQSKPPYPF